MLRGDGNGNNDSIRLLGKCLLLMGEECCLHFAPTAEPLVIVEVASKGSKGLI